MLKKLKSKWQYLWFNYMQGQEWPKGRSLYIWCAADMRSALWYMFTDWMAARFPPKWFYSVWSRKPNDGYPDDWIHGPIEGYYLHQADAEEFVRELTAQGLRAGWIQHHLSNKIYKAKP